MIENLPIFISIVFGLTTVITVLILYKAAQSSRLTLAILLCWLLIQGLVGLSEFYTITHVLPPRFLFLVLPPLFLTIALFITQRGRQFVDMLDLKTLTYLHTVRIPVELVLLWLFLHKQVPELMTFEGRNFDILSGLTAPFVAYFGFTRHKLNNQVILIWNIICLGLLFNIVFNAIFAAPSPFQKFAFEQPNVGILYFPFVWLPGCVVPIVLFAHLVAIRRLIREKKFY